MYLLFEVGGTKTRIGYSTDLETITSSQVIPTPQNPEELIHILKQHPVKATCGSLPGVFNFEKGILLTAPNLRNYVGYNFKQSLSDLLGNIPVFLENDCALAALGESLRGSGKNQKIVAYVAIGTGIGGARVVDGKIDHKAFGFEPGHQIITENGMDFEQLISGTALAKEFGHPSEHIQNPKVWEEVVEKLAIGLNNVIVFWSPNILILGGGLMEKISIEKIKSRLKKILRPFPELPQIVKAELGELSGINGALEYLKQSL